MKGVYCIRTIVEGVPDMADDFSTDNMLDMYLYAVIGTARRDCS